MPGQITINLSRPITSARIMNNDPQLKFDKREIGAAGQEQKNLQTEAQKAAFLQACRTLNNVVDRLNQFCAKVFAEHSEKIAKLSVEIARKVLVQKVENGDYEIESIIKETLKNTPGHQDLVVHLNPEDLAHVQKAQKDEVGGIFTGIKFVPDPNIGRAECLLESPKGIIESMINEHLEKIGRALTKAK